MSHVTVKFTAANEVENNRGNHLPISVDVGESLFERNGGNLTEMSDSDSREYARFINEVVTAKMAIDEAYSIIGTAPGFDGVPLSAVMGDSVDASVAIEHVE